MERTRWPAVGLLLLTAVACGDDGRPPVANDDSTSTSTTATSTSTSEASTSSGDVETGGESEGGTGSDGGDPPSRKIVPPPGGGVYLGNFPVTHDLFEQAIGRSVSISDGDRCSLSTAIVDGVETHHVPQVDMACLQAEADQGKIPQLNVLSWFCQPSAPAFTVRGVIDGEIDEALRQVARELAQWGHPVFWGYSVEPHVQWPGYGADGQECRWGCDDIEGFQGGVCDDDPGTSLPEHFTEYGDPDELDSTETYIDFHQHIHDVVEGEIERLGLPSNVTWVQGHSVTDANLEYQAEEYWVGGDYVDWHAFGYYAGATLDLDGGPAQTCDPFPGRVEYWEEMLERASDKPVMLDEFGVSREFFGNPTCTDRAAWLADFFDDLAETYPQVAAIQHVEFDTPNLWTTVVRPEDPAAQAWRDELQNRPERWPTCVAIADGSEVCRVDPGGA